MLQVGGGDLDLSVQYFLTTVNFRYKYCSLSSGVPAIFYNMHSICGIREVLCYYLNSENSIREAV